MSLRHAILTALVERPASGRQLASRFERSIGYFWAATHQQIYRELAALEDEGYVAATAVAATRGRARTYEVLPAGEAELRSWVAQAEDPRPVRDPLLVRFRARAALGEDSQEGDLDAELARHRSWHAERLRHYEEIEGRDFGPGSPADDQRRLQHLVLGAGIGLEQHWLAWLDQAHDVLESIQPPDEPTRDQQEDP